MNGRYRISLTLLLLSFAMPIPTAYAHASLILANPAVDSNLAKLPTHVEIEFDGNLIPLGGARTNVLQVQDSRGKNIDAGNSKVAGPILEVDIKDRTGEGTFTVSWRVVSSDGHPVEGSYQFSVGLPSQTLTPKATVPIVHRESFWKGHKEQIFLLIAAFIAIGIWARFERRRRAGN